MLLTSTSSQFAMRLTSYIGTSSTDQAIPTAHTCSTFRARRFLFFFDFSYGLQRFGSKAISTCTTVGNSAQMLSLDARHHKHSCINCRCNIATVRVSLRAVGTPRKHRCTGLHGGHIPCPIQVRNLDPGLDPFNRPCT